MRVRTCCRSRASTVDETRSAGRRAHVAADPARLWIVGAACGRRRARILLAAARRGMESRRAGAAFVRLAGRRRAATTRLHAVLVDTARAGAACERRIGEGDTRAALTYAALT